MRFVRLAAPLSRYALTARPPGAAGALLLNYAGFDEKPIRAGVRKLRRALETVVR